MRKKKKKGNEEKEYKFELAPPEPVILENGERNYFAEYYRAYRNTYIDQYLKAYRELKDINAAIKKVDDDPDSSKK